MELEKSERPWGRYEVLQESTAHKVKCIWVLPGKRLSYQRHQKRAEHWFIVQGTALVTIDGQDRPLGPGATVDFPIGTLHRLNAKCQVSSEFRDLYRHSCRFS